MPKSKVKKIDYKKVLAELYQPSAKEPVIIDVPRMNFIMLDGVIYPGETPESSKDFQEVMPVLYGLVYTLKFMLKGKSDIPDSIIMPLEGLWWFDEGVDFEIGKTDVPLYFTAMIMQPEHITREHYLQARAELKAKKNPSGLSKARFENWKEGKCVQIMHIGTYAEEGSTIERLHNFARERGYKLRGKHHEIYLSDPRRTAPERLKTVLRQPIE
jgi:hypothetical protein